MNIKLVRSSLVLVFLCGVLGACNAEELAAVPEPPEWPRPAVPEGTSDVVLTHGDQTVAFEHVKAVKRFDEDSGSEMVYVVFSRKPVADEALTDPFERFSWRRFATVDYPEIYPVLEVVLDPQDLAQPTACDLAGPWDWLAGNMDSCGTSESSLGDPSMQDASLDAELALVDFFGGDHEDRAWAATGAFQTEVVALERPDPVTGAEVLQSQQFKRFKAMQESLESGGVESLREHSTEESFQELMSMKEQIGEEETVQMLKGFLAEFANIDPEAENVEITLYKAGKRSELVLKVEEEGSTSTLDAPFYWVDGAWLHGG